MTSTSIPKTKLFTDHTAALLCLSLVACMVPVWTVSLPPATDLPQHLSQIFLLEETVLGNRPDLIITPWYYPNTLIYGLLYIFWHITDPITAGRLTYSILAGSWVLSTYLLCKLRNRPIENWLIGVPLVFNFIFYWGLLNFLIGWPIFCLFIAYASDTGSKRKFFIQLLIALLLYFAHALWFLMASIWLLTQLIERDQQFWIQSIAPMIPTWLLALVWYPQLTASRRASGVDTGVTWGSMPFEKLIPSYINDSALGGLQNQLEPIFLMVLGLWIATSLITRRKTLEKQIDKPIFIGALMLILAYWVLPSTYMNTIFFNKRWLPGGITLLLLALPAPRIRLSFLATFGIGWVLIISLASIIAWKDWEEEQVGGLTTAIAQLKRGERVFGLDMLGGSLFIKGSPGLQFFAYSQALKGTEINFSFVEHYSSIVQYRYEHAPNRSRKLIWEPLTVTRDHLSNFDKALIGGDETLHDFARNHLNLKEINPSQNTWRLYRIKHP